MDKENNGDEPSSTAVESLEPLGNRNKKKKTKKLKLRNGYRYFKSVAKMMPENYEASTSLASKKAPSNSTESSNNTCENIQFKKVIRTSSINNALRLKRLAKRTENRTRRSLQKMMIDSKKKAKVDSLEEEKNDDVDKNSVLVQSEDVTTSTIDSIETNDDDAADCILLENKIEQIVIDDDDDDEPGNVEEKEGDVRIISYEETDINQITKNLFEDIPILPYFEDRIGNLGTDCITLTDNTRRTERVSRTSELPNDDDGDIIIIDDSIIDDNKHKTVDNDSSCIILDDTVLDSSNTIGNEDFIPLGNIPNPVAARKSPKKRIQPDILTVKERKQLDAYSDNTYNPNPTEISKNQKRMVIIDGSNVAYAHGLSQCFSVKGLKICIEYFEKLGHEVKAVVPMYRQNFNKSSEPKEVERLHKEGKIIFTPCKNIPGLVVSSYDDRFILQLACQMDAAIISNDCYRDMIRENHAFKKIIENRVIGYTWCNDVFLLPKDPYGRLGPNLREILNRY